MTRIPATDIQTELLKELGYDGEEPVFLSYDGGWYWETSNWTTRATDADAADALLERVLVLENQVADMQYRAQLGDALQQALQATELLDQLTSVANIYPDAMVVIGNINTATV